MNSKNKQLAEAIVNIFDPAKQMTDKYKEFCAAAILPLIAEFKKEVAGEAWTACEKYAGCVELPIPPDRATYIDNISTQHNG